jgi:hypothetical protein
MEDLALGSDQDYALYFDTVTNRLFIQNAVDDTAIQIGNGTLSSDLLVYGNIPTAYQEHDASASQLGLFGPMRLRGFNRLSPRYELKWVAGARGKPGINADINSATEATREIADPDIEVLGLNAVSTTTAYNTAGGITLTTTTGSADQVMFRYGAAVNSGKIQAVSSIAGTDIETDTAVTETVSTVHHLAISIDSARLASMYLDGVLIKTTAALTSVGLIPYIGIQTDTTAAKSLVVYGQSISRAL